MNAINYVQVLFQIKEQTGMGKQSFLVHNDVTNDVA